MARRVVESAPLRGRDACARLRVFAIDELTGRDSYEARRAEGSKSRRGSKASQRIYDVCVGNARPEH